jgi:hypothetical protein
LAGRESEEQERKPPNVVFDPEPPDTLLTQEQVDAFIALMMDDIRGESLRQCEEEGNDKPA